MEKSAEIIYRLYHGGQKKQFVRSSGSHIVDVIPMIFYFATHSLHEEVPNLVDWAGEMLLECLCEYEPRGTTDPVYARFNEDMKASIDKLWPGTIAAFRRHLNAPTRSLDLLGSRPRFLGTLETIGKALKLKENMTPGEYFAGYDTPKSCHFPECMCSHKKPLHPMKICSGCHIVYYCSPKCQAGDWDYKGQGHRIVCRGRRVRRVPPGRTRSSR
ncbi:hypothetical protein K474DRAFT_988188 [Panus rudis PR-1116 ss-1]|nr:hypothetical protein K474DRAFT_988188 [Panus rudis PR-1116 ss-1]